jgi:branched-chain amino acid transport system ATP-binding protein
MLKLNNIETFIGQYHILQGVSLEVKKGEVTVLLGRNGAGKTTTLRTIMGLNPASKGSVVYKGEEIHSLPTYTIAQKGIGYVPEDQGIFAGLTVEENMKVAIQKENEETNGLMIS